MWTGSQVGDSKPLRGIVTKATAVSARRRGADGPAHARPNPPRHRPASRRSPRRAPSRPAPRRASGSALPTSPSRRGDAFPRPRRPGEGASRREPGPFGRANGAFGRRASAVAPETPASTSSKTNVRTGPLRRRPASLRVSSSASDAATASCTRASSPPEAIFASGRAASPGSARTRTSRSRCRRTRRRRPRRPPKRDSPDRVFARRRRRTTPSERRGRRGVHEPPSKGAARRRRVPPKAQAPPCGTRRRPSGRFVRLLQRPFQVRQLLALPPDPLAVGDHLR